MTPRPARMQTRPTRSTARSADLPKVPARPTAVAVMFLLLAAPLVLVIHVPEADAATTRVLAITEGSAKPKVPWKGFDGNNLKLYDFNGDGRLDIIAQNDNQWVYVFDSKTGALLAEVTTTFPSGWGARSFNGPEASIMQQGGVPKLIVANSAAMVASFRVDTVATTSTKVVLVKEWERRLNDCHSDPGMDAKPVLADLDRDGVLEILAYTEESGIYALRADGSLYWKNCLGGGNAEPAVADLNQDGWLDVVAASDGGVIAALNGRTGAWMWGFNAKSQFNLGSASIPAAPGIGQLDGVGGPDIVVGLRDSHDTSDYSKDNAMLLALSSGGNVLWKFQDPNGNPLTYTRPVIVDADKNGAPEVYWGDWNTIGHKGGIPLEDSWKVTGPANFYRIDNKGGMVWKQTLGTWWSNKDVPLADVDGDGVQEMLANGPGANGHDGIWYLDSRNGNKETFIDVWPWKVSRAPVVADLWKTGTMQWVIQVGSSDASSGGPGILVYNTGQPYNSAWPHAPGPVFTTGPISPSPPPPPPPPSGTFTASFSGVRGNEWWVQANVASGGDALASVHARLNGGDWRPLAKQSWGGWAASFQMVDGTAVQLRATSSGGATVLSDCYRWIPPANTDASKMTCPSAPSPPPPPPPPPPSGYAPAFTQVRGNEWWVQASVEGTPASVDVRMNGGTWRPLAKQSWGGWAASYHIPQGTTVQLRATSSVGNVALSDCYGWIPPSNTDASKVSCTSGSGDGTFTATFTVPSGVNNWWVEVAVKASGGTVAKVDARVDGGAWVALDKTSWGTWAKSFHVASGSQVQFRATSDTGATALSGTTTWK